MALGGANGTICVSGAKLIALPTRMSLLWFFFLYCKCVQNEKSEYITSIRSDYEGRFENEYFQEFCMGSEILHNLSTLRTS